MSTVTDETTGLEKAVISTDNGTKAEVHLHGAHITSFKPLGDNEVIFVSKDAIFEPPKAIRGGIPICWPQFNNMGPGRAHGFARNSAFEVEELVSDRVVLCLKSSEATKEHFPYDFELRIQVSVSDNNGGTLFQAMEVRNTGPEPFGTTHALHTYFKVSDIANVEVLGLESCSYLDNLAARTSCPASGSPLTISEEVDRIYSLSGAGENVVLRDRVAAREVVLQMMNFSDVVVWNPWIEKAMRTADFGDEEYREMLCLEAADAALHEAGQSVQIPPGEAWFATQAINVRALSS